MLFIAGLAPSTTAQTFRGRVLTEGDDAPVPAAYLRLLHPDGGTAAVTFADSAGRYRVEAPTSGEYRIVAEQLAYETFTSPLLAAESGNRIYPVDVVLRREPIPVEGVVVTAVRREVLEREIRKELGVDPTSLRFEPIGPEEIQENAERGRGVVGLIRWENTPSLSVQGSGEELCFRYRARSCLPVYLDGARLSPGLVSVVSLDMLETAVIVTPTDPVPFQVGGILLYSRGFLR